MDIQKKYFGNYKNQRADIPNLAEVQLSSYQWLFGRGLRELFNEVSPLKEDFGGFEMALEFVDYYLDEPKYTEQEAREKNLSYEAPLRIKARLTNKKTKEAKEQEIYLGDFPLMTSRGTFVVNGVERVIVSQLIRSSGVYFTSYISRGKRYFGAKIIPNRGAWIEFETDVDGSICVKIDRRRKTPATAIFRAFALVDEEKILSLLADIDTGEERIFSSSTRPNA